MTDNENDQDQASVPAQDRSDSWKEQLVYRKPGHAEPNSLANLICILKYAPKWKGVFVHDEFTDEILVRRCPPYLMEDEFLVHKLEHNDIVATAATMEYDGMTSSVTRTYDAIKYVSKQNSIHPVREYFDGLKWDGIARLNTWLADHMNATAQDGDYLASVGTKWLVAAVTRIYEPGAKFDHMLVLEGKQGLGKSFGLRTLATFGEGDKEIDCFTDNIRFENMSATDAVMILRGKLIVEFAELAGMNKRETEDVKHWITIQVDQIRKPYETQPTTYKRQFILAGTTNEDAWLRDPTGNRRFLPVKVMARIDIAALKSVREQLWAEAVQRYKQGTNIFIEPGSDFEQQSLKEQEGRLIEDVWTDQVLHYVKDLPTVAMSEILQGISVDIGRRDELAAKRVGRILRANGWEKDQRWEGGRNRKIWVNPKHANPGTSDLPFGDDAPT